MDDINTPPSKIAPGAPITEADLHGYADRQLTPARLAEVDQYLNDRPDERQRVRDWQRQNELMRHLLDPVLDEPLPLRIPLRPRATTYPWRGLAAGLLIAMLSSGSGWVVRGSVDLAASRQGQQQSASAVAANGAELSDRADDGSSGLNGFARRAAVAHVVYSPDVRRPVELGADQEQQLVSWLSKRLGTAVKPPNLQGVGYELIGGRLLPGDSGPVAQFMYHDAAGQRLTLYVTREVSKLDGQAETAFRFGRDGPVNVFYWVDKNFGYAISGGADRQALTRVSQEVYRQLDPS